MPTITIAQAATTLNRHHVVHDKNIQSTIKQGITLDKHLRTVSCEHTYTSTSAEVGDILQAYQCDFTPNNNVEFKAIDNKLQRMKVDILFNCDQLDQFYDSWMCEWVEDGKPKLVWTFPKWIYEKKILPKLIENLAFVSFNGIYQPPTIGQPGVKVNACDGLRVKIQQAVATGLTTPIPTGALQANGIVNQVESFCDAIPLPYRNMPGVLLMSPTNARRYQRDYRAEFGSGNGVLNPNNELRVDHTNKRAVGVDEMEGSDGILFIPDVVSSALLGRKKGQPFLPRIRWQEFERQLKGLAEFSRFYGFDFWGHIFVNDQF